ncbi:MAG: hypothetical protein IPK82_32985 [Polyangiaceae bacterium]|nr:hypothetical protein [Polyangiaceae bacterium]
MKTKNLSSGGLQKVGLAAVMAVAAGLFGCYRTVYVRDPGPPPSPDLGPPAPAAVVVDASADGEVVEDFYQPLSYYGVWVNVPPYGWVWQPASDMAGADFRPYATDGNWALNDDGDWVFVSRYHTQWGWATYHYGRWVWNDWYGWVWIPGTRWAPAWVEWRYGGGYVGWAPLGPAGTVLVENHYIFVQHTHFCQSNVYVYHVPPDHVHHAYTAAQPTIGGVGAPYNKPGPPPLELKAAGVSVPSFKIGAPERGYIKTQGRLAMTAGSERQRAGKVSTTPELRGRAAYTQPAAQNGRTAPQVEPGTNAGVVTQPGMTQTQPSVHPGSSTDRPNASPNMTGPSAPDPRAQPAPDPRAAPVPSGYTPVPAPTATSRPGATPAPTTGPAPTSRPTPAPTPTTRPSAAPTPTATTRPSPAPTPKPTTTARPKPAPTKPKKSGR